MEMSSIKKENQFLKKSNKTWKNMIKNKNKLKSQNYFQKFKNNLQRERFLIKKDV